MSKNKPKNSTLTELKQKKKNLKTITLALAAVIAFMIGVCIYSTIHKGVDFFTFMPLFFLPILVVNVYEIKKT